MRNLRSIWSVLPALTLLTAVAGCGGGADSSSKESASQSDPAQVSVRALPDDVSDAICSLTRHSRESELVAAFGEPQERKDGPGMVLLRWKTETWYADAMISDGKLTIASANVRQDPPAKQGKLDSKEQWTPGLDGNRLDEMEGELGAGSLVGVVWHPGMDVARSVRNSPNFDPSILQDRCNFIYAWPNADGISYGTAQFTSDGTLAGLF